MKYAREIKKIEKLIEENKLQESAEKMFSLGEKDIEIWECLNEKLTHGEMIKESIKEYAEFSISQTEGDIFNIDELEDETYYNVIENDCETIVFKLTDSVLEELFEEISQIVA